MIIAHRTRVRIGERRNKCHRGKKRTELFLVIFFDELLNF